MTDTRLIHNVGAGALEWLWAHRDGFQLEPDVDPEVGFLERFKPIGELAMICKVLFREGVAGSRQAQLARQLLDHAWRETLDGGRMLVRGQLTEPISPIPFEVYLPFKELGYSQPEVERAAVLNHRLDSWVAFEATPTRRLGLSAFQRRFGLAPRPPEAELRDTTWLARTPEPWTVEGPHRLRHHAQRVPPDRLGREAGRAVARTSPTTSRPGCRSGSTTGWTWSAGTCSASCWWSTPACPARPWTNGPGRASPPHSSPTGPCPRCASMPEGAPDEVFDIVYHPTLVAAYASVLATSRSLSRLAHAS